TSTATVLTSESPAIQYNQRAPFRRWRSSGAGPASAGLAGAGAAGALARRADAVNGWAGTGPKAAVKGAEAAAAGWDGRDAGGRGGRRKGLAAPPAGVLCV